ncbi:MAG: hypothetical protein RLY87_1481 [Chloroflexota bacterium]
MARMRTRSVQFGQTNGENTASEELILMCEAIDPMSVEARKGELFVLLEGGTDHHKHRNAIQMVMRTIQKLFYENASFSIHASLRRAIMAANQSLYEYNISHMPQHRISFGMTCAVIKGNDLYIAQILPAQTYILSEGQMRAIPAGPLWRHSQQSASTAVSNGLLGGSLSVEPEFYRAPLLQREGVILVTSNMARVLGRDDLAPIMRSGDVALMAEGMHAVLRDATVGDVYGIAILLDMTTEVQRQATSSFSSITQQLMVATDNTGLWFARLVSWARALLIGAQERRFSQSGNNYRGIVREEQQRMHRQPPEVPYTVDPIPTPAPLDVGEDIDVQVERLGRVDKVKNRSERPQQVIEAVDVEVPSTPLDTNYRATPGRYRTQQTEPIKYSELMGSVFTRLLSQRWFRMPTPTQRRMQSVSRGEGLSYRKQKPPFPWAMLSLMGAVIAVLFFYGTNVARENRLQRSENSIVSAEVAVQSISDAVNERDAELRIELARTMLTDLQQSGVFTATTSNRQRYFTMINKIEKAERIVQRRSLLEEIQAVAQHPLKSGMFTSVIVPPPATSIENASNFEMIYLYDGNAGILYNVPREGGTPTPMLQPNALIGDVTVAKVFDIAWRIDSIIAIAQSANNGPYIYFFRNGNDWNYSILAGSLEWNPSERSMRVQSFGGNLYVWGVTASNILRYLSTQFGDFPTPWIQNDGGQSFETAVDMGIDGHIYLLMPNGSIKVFTQVADGERGYERTINLPPITPPVRSVSRMVVTGDGDAGYFYLVDSYGGRIIQLEKRSGRFIQQIAVATDSEIQLDNLTSVAIDETQARPMLYFVNGGTLYKAPLPDPPSPYTQREDNVVLPTPIPPTP